MNFTLFNPTLLNSINKKVKFKSFNQKSYRQLKEACEYYQKIPYSYLGLSGKDVSAHKKYLLKEIKNANAKAFKHHLKEYREDCLLYKQQQEYLNIQEELNSDVWQEWSINKSINSKQIVKIHKIWEANNATSHYPSEALCIAALFIIPIFENFNHLANQEINFYYKKLTEHSRYHLKKYVSSLADEIQVERHKICEAMVARLEVAAFYSDITKDDITYHVLQNIQQLGIEFKNIKNPRQGLTQDLFGFFHRYLYLHADIPQLARLNNLVWLRDDSNFFSQCVDEEFLIVPRQMSRFKIPTKSKDYLTWFYRWHNFRIRFFKDRFYLLANLRLATEQNYLSGMDLHTLLEGKRWQVLNKLEQALLQEGQNASVSTVSLINRFIFYKRYNFYKVWGLVSQKSLETILQQKIAYASLLSEQLQTRLMTALDCDVLFSRVNQEMLLDIISSIEKLSIQLNRKKNTYWLNIKKIFLQTLNYDPVSLGRGYEERFSTQKLILELQSGQENKNIKTELNNEESNLTNHLNKIFMSLVKGQHFVVGTTSFSHGLSELENLFINYTGANIQELNFFWVNFFCVYLRTYLLNTSHEKDLKQVFDLIAAFAPNHIKTRALALKESFENQSLFLCQTKCRAMLFSFTATNNEPMAFENVRYKFHN